MFYILPPSYTPCQTFSPTAISSGCNLHEPTLQSPTRKFGLRHPKAATMRFDKEFLIVLFLSLSLFLAFLFYTSHAIFYGIPFVFLGIVLLYFSLPNESRKIKYRKKID